MTRGIIFDMDGVLTDSSPIHAWAFQEVLRPYGIVVDYPKIAGMRTLDVIQMMAPAGADAVRLAEEKSALALRRMREENPVVPGALDVVERLSARFPLALASSGSPESVGAFLEMNSARSLFQVVLTGSDVKAAKPAPDIYLEACAAVGFCAGRVPGGGRCRGGGAGGTGGRMRGRDGDGGCRVACGSVAASEPGAVDGDYSGGGSWIAIGLRSAEDPVSGGGSDDS